MRTIQTKQPADCVLKGKIRISIDRIDMEIISLFSLRFNYVREIVKYQADSEKRVVGTTG